MARRALAGWIVAVAVALYSAPAFGGIPIKSGVELGCLRIPAYAIIVETDTIFRRYGYQLVITGGCESAKDRILNTLHAKGLAIDFRTRHVPRSLRPRIADALRRHLPDAFDVVLERDHLHVEFELPRH